MESTIGIIIAVIIVLIIFGAFTAAVISNRKRKAASWTGVVVDKNIQERVQESNSYNNSNDSSGMNIRLGGIGLSTGNSSNNGVSVTHSYFVSVRPEGGEVFDWSVSSGFYETVSIGDRLSKPSGTLTPEIVEKAVVAPVDEASSSTPPTLPTPPVPPATPSL